MNPNPHILANTGVVGATVSIGSAITAWCASALPVVQFSAALLGGAAAAVSIAWIIKQWHSKAK